MPARYATSASIRASSAQAHRDFIPAPSRVLRTHCCGCATCRSSSSPVDHSHGDSMTSIQAHIRSAGAGPAVLLLHSSGARPPVAATDGTARRTHALRRRGFTWPRRHHRLAARAAADPRRRGRVARAAARSPGARPSGRPFLRRRGCAEDGDTPSRSGPQRRGYEPVLFRLLLDYHPRNATSAGRAARRHLGPQRDPARRNRQKRPSASSILVRRGHLVVAADWRSRPVIAARMPEVLRHFDACSAMD